MLQKLYRPRSICIRRLTLFSGASFVDCALAQYANTCSLGADQATVCRRMRQTESAGQAEREREKLTRAARSNDDTAKDPTDLTACTNPPLAEPKADQAQKRTETTQLSSKADPSRNNETENRSLLKQGI